jgi:CubicO group peptidase (beta-lactamase class C family)
MLRAILYLAFRLATLVLVFSCMKAIAQSQLPADTQRKIDKVATDALAKTGVPSTSVAVVKDGQIVYLHAYGNARLDPETAAKTEMRYSIGSVSKQFTAAAILLLEEQGKLSLDDKVGKFVPSLTRADEVTIRQLLSHTSGYQDYWPQDYVMPMMLQPTTAEKILDVWGHKPLDFEPGTKWQYSNTNYVIAGVIVEKVSGEPLLQFLQQKIFAPLNMNSVADTDKTKLGDTDPTGYLRYALGPPRPGKEVAGSLRRANWLCLRRTWLGGTFQLSIRI